MSWILELDCSFPFLNKSGEHFGYVILDLYWHVCVCTCGGVEYQSKDLKLSRLLPNFSYFVLVPSHVLGSGDNEKQFLLFGCPFRTGLRRACL